MSTETKWYEKEKFSSFWEVGYRNNTVSTMGGPSIEVYEILNSLPAGAKVIDLGCGEGRNALFLAKHGCEVTAIDHSKTAIDKVRKGADTLGVNVKTMVCDLNEFEPKEKYDLVLAHGVLHFLDIENWRKLLSKLKESTNIGGFHSFSVFMPTDEYDVPDEIKAAGHKKSFKKGDINDFYGDWQRIRFDSYAKWDKHPEIPMHVHYTEKIIARKVFEIEKGYEVKSLYKDHDVITKEQFESVEIGFNENQVIEICGEVGLIDEVNFGTETIGAKNLTDKDYILKDLYYGKVAFQLINGEVRGKYIYDTEPTRVSID